MNYTFRSGPIFAPDTSVLHTIPETASMLGTSPKLVRKLVKSGELKATMLGKLKVTDEEIKNYLHKGDNNMSTTITSTNNTKELSPIVYTVPELATLLHTTNTTVRSLIKCGHIRAMKLGEIKVSQQEVERFLNESVNVDYTDPTNLKPVVA